MPRKKSKSTSKKTRRKKSSDRPESATPQMGELVFVVDVDSFTKNGFQCSSSFEGKRIEVEFDDADEGLTLSEEMCGRAGLATGSAVTIAVDDERNVEAFGSTVASVGDNLRFSSGRLYYLVGGLGGAIVRIRKA